MLPNKLGYDLPGNVFYVVPKDFAIRKQGFIWKCHCKVHTLGENWTHREMELELSFPLGSCLDADGDGKHIPVHQLGVFIVLDLPGKENPFQFVSAPWGQRENPKAGCIPWDPVPAGNRGTKLRGSIQLWCHRAELAMSNPARTVLSAGWISWRNLPG